MRSIIYLFLFTIIFVHISFAQKTKPKDSKLPAEIASWVGKDSNKILENKVIKMRLQKLLGKKNYASFIGSFETLSSIEKQDNFLFSSGCLIRACTHLESAVAIDLGNKTIHAAIYNDIEETKYFNENRNKTPAPVIKWATRLENLKKSSSVKNEDQSQAELVTEFNLNTNEVLLLELDNFVNRLQDDPTASGRITINGNKKSRTKAEKQIKNHIKNRGFDFNRLIFINGDGNSKVLIKLWIVPAGAESTAPKKSVKQKNSDKPIEAEPLAALVEELKGVVSRITPDKNEAKLVAKKWDKRTDLAGKTKNEVIELLFDNVKSVIKDSGTQYQIYSIFSFYKNVDLDVKSILIDSFSYANREDMMARIDSFTVELQNNLSAKGYIVIKGKKPARITAEKEIKDYLKMRAFDMKNFVFLNGDGDKTTEIELWLVPPGAKPPAQKKAGGTPETNKPQSFKIDEFTFVNNEDLLLRLDNYVNSLQDDPSAIGYIIINGNKNSRTKAENQIKDHIKNRGLDFSRLVFLNSDGDSKAVIELWLAPSGAEPPVAEKTVAKPNKNLTSKVQPMESKAVAALILELKGVVSGITPDKNEAKLVGERWDKRKDIAGKNKNDVIELLYADVKSVIKDSGTQYQIYSMFSFYKNIPDESFSTETKETDVVVKKNPLKLKLNNEDQGTTDDTSVIAKRLEKVFKNREKEGVFRQESNEIETTVYLQGDRSVLAEEVAKLFGAVRDSGASPILVRVQKEVPDTMPNPLKLVVYAGSGKPGYFGNGIEIGFMGELFENRNSVTGDKGAIAVVAGKNGTFTMDGKQISASDLKIKIESRLKTKEKGKKIIFVQADNYGNIEDAAGIAASAGAVRVYVITKNIEHREYGISFSLSSAYLKDQEEIGEEPSVRFVGSDSSFEINLHDELVDKESAESEITTWYELRKERFKQAEVSFTEIDGSSGVLTIYKDVEDYQADWFGFRKKNGKQQMVLIVFNCPKKESNYSHYEFLQIIKSIKFN